MNPGTRTTKHKSGKSMFMPKETSDQLADAKSNISALKDRLNMQKVTLTSMGGYRHPPSEWEMIKSPNPNSALGATGHKTHIAMYKK